MNTPPTFKSRYLTCPICNHSSAVPSTQDFRGLFTCPHCHSHIVITWSGHYVRDPFGLQKSSIEQLRHQSNPWVRLRRDLGMKCLPILAIMGSALIFSAAIASFQHTHNNRKSESIKNLPAWAQTTHDVGEDIR